jgi:hypothetical protein
MQQDTTNLDHDLNIPYTTIMIIRSLPSALERGVKLPMRDGSQSILELRYTYNSHSLVTQYRGKKLSQKMKARKETDLFKGAI